MVFAPPFLKKMDDKIRIFGFLLAAFAVSAIAFMGFGGWLGYQRGYERAKKECHSADADTVYKTDTVIIDLFHTDTIIKTIQVPFLVGVTDTIVDSVLVSLPMEWHHTHVEDTADVWYHGVMAGIDSMRFYSTTKVVTDQKTFFKEPRLAANLGCGSVYSLDKVNTCLFCELLWNRPKTTFSAIAFVNHEGVWGIGGGVSYRINIIK